MTIQRKHKSSPPPAVVRDWREGDDELLNESQAAKELGMSVAWMRRKRQEGAKNGDAGAPYIKLGESVRYRRGDLRHYVQSRRIDRAANALPAQSSEQSAA